MQPKITRDLNGQFFYFIRFVVDWIGNKAIKEQWNVGIASDAKCGSISDVRVRVHFQNRRDALRCKNRMFTSFNSEITVFYSFIFRARLKILRSQIYSGNSSSIIHTNRMRKTHKIWRRFFFVASVFMRCDHFSLFFCFSLTFSFYFFFSFCAVFWARWLHLSFLFLCVAP